MIDCVYYRHSKHVIGFHGNSKIFVKPKCVFLSLKTYIWLLINTIQYKSKVVTAALANSAAIKTV